MELGIKEKAWKGAAGVKYHDRTEELVIEDGFFTRKYSETTPRSSLEKIFDAYHDYCESRQWD